MKLTATEVACPRGVTDRDRRLASVESDNELAADCVFRVCLSACEADVGGECA